MRRAVLLGDPDTRRTQYFMQAAAQVGLPLSFWDWNNWKEKIRELSPDGILLKIDPPCWDSPSLLELDRLAGDYKKQLSELASAADSCNIRFLNHPSAIASLLDKMECKEVLIRAGIPVTELLAGNVSNRRKAEAEKEPSYALLQDTEQLLEFMQSRNICQVFIKPANGSGAAGVSAFRWQKSSGRMALYTCAWEEPKKGLVNTKRLRCFSDVNQVLFLLRQLFQTECVIERWHAKAAYQKHSYDLRAVVQGGRIDCLLARLSRGPITNLQLNNRPLDAETLGLLPSVRNEVRELCLKAMKLYPGLFCAGIDVLLEKGSLKPRIIEMNGQGDLIYQDIFHENRIYRRQAEYMKQEREKG